MITHCECNSGFLLKSTANDDYIESNEQFDKCVKFDVREDSTVGVKIAELLRLNVSTSIDEQFSLKVQKTAEAPRTQFHRLTSRSCNRGRSSRSSCTEDRGDAQIQYQRCRLSRRPWRLHKCSSWTRLSTCPLWCNAKCSWFRWCRKQLVVKKGRARA